SVQPEPVRLPTQQTPLPQSVSAMHPEPSPHLLLQEPPQSWSVSSPLSTPSVQVAARQVFLVQALPWTSVPVLQQTPLRQSGWSPRRPRAAQWWRWPPLIPEKPAVGGWIATVPLNPGLPLMSSTCVPPNWLLMLALTASATPTLLMAAEIRPAMVVG